jgi:pimeloyl-ACP methyl ester carboxylesterase
VLALLVSLAAALGVGCGNENPPSRSHAAVGPDRGELVEIGGGRGLLVHCTGSGDPTVVLDAGFGVGSFAWQGVQPALSRTTRVCSYDRAGTGSSVAVPGVRDARDEVADLERLLDKVGARPPYVLAGHSYGGVVARVFALLRPAETAGLVLIDTEGRDGRRRQLAMWPTSEARAIRRQLATSRMAGIDLGAGEALASRIGTLGDKPLAVVTAGREDNFPRTPARLHDGLMRLWNRMQDELAALSDDRVHVVALDSDHDIPSGQPAVVVRAVEAVVHAARDHTHLPACRDLFTEADVRCRG